jgi:GTPase SAR1 family protein
MIVDRHNFVGVMSRTTEHLRVLQSRRMSQMLRRWLTEADLCCRTGTHAVGTMGGGQSHLCCCPAVIVLVGNKSDLENERQVPTSEAREYADRSVSAESACHTTPVLACHMRTRNRAADLQD